jgi:hemerythrin-like domain-containing protein
MAQNALETIKAEHQSIARVLTTLRAQVDGLQVSDARSRVTDRLYAMLYYMRVFPDRLHHPKEEEYLFHLVEKRSDKARAVISALQDEHERGEHMLESIQQALRDFERTPNANTLGVLRDHVHAYVDLEFQHMRTEEDELMPLARRTLRADDWAIIDQAFATNADPLFQSNVELGFDALYRQIIDHSPEGT